MEKTTQIKPFGSTYVVFGADNRTCSERSERNSISEQVYLQSVAPAAQRAGANKRSAVCRQNAVLFQDRCRMKKDNPSDCLFLAIQYEMATPLSHQNTPDLIPFPNDIIIIALFMIKISKKCFRCRAFIIYRKKSETDVSDFPAFRYFLVFVFRL